MEKKKELKEELADQFLNVIRPPKEKKPKFKLFTETDEYFEGVEKDAEERGEL